MYYKYKQIKIYYEKYNSNKKNNILILPGWGDTRNTFNYLINNIKNHNIYIIDYPNFGKSKKLTKELTIYDYSELIYNFIKDNNITNPAIIAHSFGGRITAILLTKYNIKINKLILIDVAGIKRINIKVLIYKLLKKIINIFPNKIKVKLKEKLYKKFSSNDYINLNSIMQKTFKNIVNEDIKKYYKNIKTDTLIIWGEKDKDTPLKDGILLNKLIKNSALIVYKNAYHYSYLNYPILTSKIINTYIKKESN